MVQRSKQSLLANLILYSMKNIIISVIIIVAVVGLGYYIFNKPNTKSNSSLVGVLEGSQIVPTVPGQTASTTQTNLEQAIPTQATLQQAPNKKTNKTSHMVTIETNYGVIVFETYDNDAPNTVKNFVTLAGKGFYNNLIFHRVIKGFMIQGGDPKGDGTGGPGYQFADELNQNTDSYKAGYKKGVVAMANAGSNTNGSQFFIMTADYPLPNNYTIFGHVVSGQDIVDKIANVQIGAGDKPLTPVTMKTVSAN